MITLNLPFPPSVNTYWRHVNLKGRGMATIISERGRRYREDVGDYIYKMRAAHQLKGRLEVRIKLTMPDRRRRDVDNYFKAALDALTKANVWMDDEQIDVLQVQRVGVSAPGRAEIEIHEILTN